MVGKDRERTLFFLANATAIQADTSDRLKMKSAKELYYMLPEAFRMEVNSSATGSIWLGPILAEQQKVNK